MTREGKIDAGKFAAKVCGDARCTLQAALIDVLPRPVGAGYRGSLKTAGHGMPVTENVAVAPQSSPKHIGLTS